MAPLNPPIKVVYIYSAAVRPSVHLCLSQARMSAIATAVDLVRRRCQFITLSIQFCVQLDGCALRGPVCASYVCLMFSAHAGNVSSIAVCCCVYCSAADLEGAVF